MLIGARTGAWAAIGGEPSIPYYQDNLIAWWNGSAHQGDDNTKWTDLISGLQYIGNCSSMTQYGPYGDGSDNANGMKASAAILHDLSQYTIEIAFVSENNPYNQYWVNWGTSEINGNNRYQMNIEGNMRLHPIDGTVQTLNTGISDIQYKKGTISFTYDGSNISLYWNGSKTSEIGYSQSSSRSIMSSEFMSIFNRMNATSFVSERFAGTICSQRIYSTAIPESAIEDNYLVDKSLFPIL